MSSRSSFEETDTPILLLQTLNIVNRWGFCKSDYIARDPEQLFFFSPRTTLHQKESWEQVLHNEKLTCMNVISSQSWIFVGGCPLGGTRILATWVLPWLLSKTFHCMSKIHGSHPSCMPQLPYLGIYGKPVFLMLCLKVQGPFCNTAFSSVAQLCPTLCDPMDCSTLGFPVHHQLP